MNRIYIKPTCSLILLVLLSACGIGEKNGNNEVLTGVFIDSPVKGLRWASGDMTGTTDTTGKFQYRSGAIVKFYVGDILLGEAVGNSVLIPVDIVSDAKDINDPAVTNIVRFLMTLDEDNDPENGIEITNVVADLALKKSINFNQSTAAFSASTDIQILLSTLSSATASGARPLISVSGARSHLGASIANLLAGTYQGTYSGDDSGDDSGTWTGTLGKFGVFSGTGISSSGSTAIFSGVVNTNGSGLTEFTASGGASDGTTFSGVFKTNGNVSGTWNWFNEETGLWQGTKENKTNVNGKKAKGTLTRLTTNFNNEGAPNLHPTKNILVFNSDRSGKNNLRTKIIGEQKSTILTSPPDYNFNPQFSNDGNSVIFISNRDFQNDIWTIDLDGNNLNQLTNTYYTERSPDIAGDNNIIIFDSNELGNNDIWSLNLTTSAKTQLTFSNEGELKPHFSPDDKKIVYYAIRGSNRDIWTMNADGTNKTKLTDTLAAEGHPHFSNDGTKIVFWSERTGNREVWTMNVDGSNQQQITNNPANDGGGVFSRDDSKIIFRSDRLGKNDIWEIVL